MLLAAETAGDEAVGFAARCGDARPVLLLAPVRAAAVLRRPVPGHKPVALRLADHQLTPETLRMLADPRPGSRHAGSDGIWTAPEHAAASLLLAKLGHLLPAVLAARCRPDTPRRRGGWASLACRPEHVRAARTAIATALRRVAEARVPLEGAEESRVVAFRAAEAGVDHLAILIGEPETAPSAARANPLRMLHRRPARQPALRLRAAVARRDPPHG